MKKDPTVTLKIDARWMWIAVLDSASGTRGRYTVYRILRGGDKRADVVGRELELRGARKLADQGPPAEGPEGPDFTHHCAWREASLKLASCVVATIRTDGKIGMGTGMVMRVVDGKKVIERWDKDFVEALSFIGLEVVDARPKKSPSKGHAMQKSPRGRERAA